MQIGRFVARALAALSLSALAQAAWTQAYPSKPIRVVTTAPGGSSDIVLRLLMPQLNASWGQPLVIDNRGLIDAELVSNATPDGYTYLLDGSSTWITPLLQK